MPRFMLIVKGDVPAGFVPSQDMIDTMNRYNEELAKAGVLLDLSGLKPSSEGARVQFSKGKRTKVIDGPFAESKELIAGYWIIDVKSIEEAIEWAKRAPMEPSPEFGDEEPVIEVRPFFELEEFGDGPAIDRARELGKELEKRKA
jgi:hypothetical protein